MGTRADFYVGRGVSAEWLGSIAWDGHSTSICKQVLGSTSVEAYRHAVNKFLEERDDASLPEDGWPWPWEDSNTTDYAYSFDNGVVYGTCFGHGWWPAENEPEEHPDDPKVIFPDMTKIQNITMGKRSGVIVIGG